MNRDPAEPIESLLKLAGARDRPSDAGFERARQAAYLSWQRGIGSSAAAPAGSRRVHWYAAAAVLIAVTTAAVWMREMSPRPVQGRVVAVQGEARVSDRPGELAVDARLRSGDVLSTGEGRVALSLDDSISLRIDRATHLRFEAPGVVTLLDGAVYVDTGGLVAEKPLRIATPAGEVRHVGTQFLVRVQGESTRVQVREGRVLLTPPGRPALDLGLGDRAEVSGADMRVTRDTVTHGPDWEWATLTAPAFDIENRPLSEFLAWLAREHGWQLRFVDAGIQPYLREVRLHGSMEGLDHREMLARAALITGVSLDLRDGVLWVGSGSSP